MTDYSIGIAYGTGYIAKEKINKQKIKNGGS